jgi:hypothetical protein
MEVSYTSERCIPWEPIPRDANRYMVLNVALFEQTALGSLGTPVSIVVVSSHTGEHPQGGTAIAWRIELQHVAAYRTCDITLWKGVCPYSDVTSKRLDVALWEIENSTWLTECVSAERIARTHPHHFVIASSFHVFEIAAATWESEELGEWLRVREDLRRWKIRDSGTLKDQ